MESDKNTCAVICAYNEQGSVGKVVKRAQKYVDRVVVVDDGSRDQTSAEACFAGATMILHEHNLGKGAALQSGFKYFLNSNYQNVITLDADGQHNPESIPAFIETLEQDYDAAIGMRDFKSQDTPILRRIGNKLDSYILSSILKTEISDPQNGFRIFKRKTLESIIEELHNSSFSFEIELLIKMTRQEMNIGWVPIETIYDKKIKSHIRPIRHIKDSIALYWKAWRGKI